MSTRYLNPERVNQLKTAIRHGKLTLFCFFITAIFVRDYTHIEKFSMPVTAPNCLVNISAAGKPHTLGPKITNWDEQRSNWLKKHPNFPNFIAPDKPRVMLVTGSSPKPCENAVGDYYLLKSIKSKIDYCRIHGIQIYYNMALFDPEMTGFWLKLPLIRNLMVTHPEIEFFWWMDSDAMFTDMAFEVPWERYGESNFVIHGRNRLVYDERSWLGLNAGTFLVRNCQWGLDFLDTLAGMGPKGAVREEAGRVLARELKNRQVYEADDQSAMVYILATQRDKWGDKVYLESEYCLYGFWAMLAERYEEMIDKYHPNLGDDRWPLITHFVGCKACGLEYSDYALDICLKQMDRAYNFGDNQVLNLYGFTHNSLSSQKVKQLGNGSGVDEYGLLHVPFQSCKIDRKN